MTHIPFPQAISHGWQCPVCRAVYAPHFPVCTRCSSPPQTATAPTTGTPLPDGPFFVFSFAEYYPAGGAGDCQAISATLEEAKERLHEVASSDFAYICVVRDGKFEEVFNADEL